MIWPPSIFSSCSLLLWTVNLLQLCLVLSLHHHFLTNVHTVMGRHLLFLHCRNVQAESSQLENVNGQQCFGPVSYLQREKGQEWVLKNVFFFLYKLLLLSYCLHIFIVFFPQEKYWFYEGFFYTGHRLTIPTSSILTRPRCPLLELPDVRKVLL